MVEALKKSFLEQCRRVQGEFGVSARYVSAILYGDAHHGFAMH